MVQKRTMQLARGIWYAGLAAAVLVASSAPFGPARAYCPWTRNTWPSIPVRLHADLHNQLWHADGTSWTRAELERAVRITIARLNDSAGADVPHVYLDQSVAPSNCAWLDSDCDGDPNVGQTCGISGVVHIVPTNCEGTWFYGTPQGGYNIALQRSHAGTTKRWEHHSSGVASLLTQDLLHELGHVLGLGEGFDCSSWSTVCPSGSNPCSAMEFSYSNLRALEYFMPDDRDGLRFLYGGPRALPAERQFESYNLSSGVTEWYFPNINAQGFFAGSSYATTSPTSVTLVGYRRDASDGSPVAYSWDWPTSQ